VFACRKWDGRNPTLCQPDLRAFAEQMSVFIDREALDEDD
jgi:hypothetical protein